MIEARLIDHEDISTNTEFWTRYGVEATTMFYNETYAVVITQSKNIGTYGAQANLSELLEGAEVSDVWVGYDYPTNAIAVILRADADAVSAHHDTIIDQFCNRQPQRSTVEHVRNQDGSTLAVMAMYFVPTVRKLRIGVFGSVFSK